MFVSDMRIAAVPGGLVVGGVEALHSSPARLDGPGEGVWLVSRRAWAMFVALSLLWGIPYLLIRVAVQDFNPVVVAFGRTALGGLLLLPVAIFRRELGAVLRRWKHVLLYTACEIIGPWWLLSYAETRLDSSTSGLLVSMVPLVVAVILIVKGRDRFGLRRGMGLVMGFGGVAVLVAADIDLSDGWAVGAAMLTVIGYSFGAYMMGHLVHDIPPYGVITASLLIAATVYLPFAIWLAPAHITAAAGWSVVSLAVLPTATAFVIMFRLVAEAGASRASVVTYINPAVAIVLGVLVLSEPMTIGLAVGFPLIILGAVLATSRSKPTRSSGAVTADGPS